MLTSRWNAKTIFCKQKPIIERKTGSPSTCFLVLFLADVFVLFTSRKGYRKFNYSFMHCAVGKEQRQLLESTVHDTNSIFLSTNPISLSLCLQNNAYIHKIMCLHLQLYRLHTYSYNRH